MNLDSSESLPASTSDTPTSPPPPPRPRWKKRVALGAGVFGILGACIFAL